MFASGTLSTSTYEPPPLDDAIILTYEFTLTPCDVLFTFGDVLAQLKSNVVDAVEVKVVTPGVIDPLAMLQFPATKEYVPVARVNLSSPDVVRLLVTETVKPSETTDAKAFIAVAIVAAESVVFNAAVVLVLNVTVNVPPVG